MFTGINIAVTSGFVSYPGTPELCWRVFVFVFPS